jgi:hypothetical protein
MPQAVVRDQARLPQRRLTTSCYLASAEVRVTWGHLSLFW